MFGFKWLITQMNNAKISIFNEKNVRIMLKNVAQNVKSF